MHSRHRRLQRYISIPIGDMAVTAPQNGSQCRLSRPVAPTSCADGAPGLLVTARAGAGEAPRPSGAADAGAWTPARLAWYGVVVLTLAQVVSYIDRFLPSLLVGPLKSDLRLSDLQVGLLLGPAFGVLYVLMGLPIGWLADRVNRSPGLLLAALLLTLREPERRERIAQGIALDTKGQVSLSGAIRFIAQHWRAFGLLFVGSGCTVTLGSLVLWNTALFDRTWGWSVRDVGVATGLAFFCGGPVGTALGLWLTNRWIARGRKDATARALLTGLALAIPGFAVYPLMPSARLAMAAGFLAFTGQAAAAVP